jgi:hypothetical protein
MSRPERDFAPWLLLSCVVLTLGSVTLLAPHQAALAAPPASTQPAPNLPAEKAPVYDDGDGDELLEHWGDPKFSREARLQLSGIAVGFLVLGAVNACRRPRRDVSGEIVELPTEADFLKLDSSAASHAQSTSRKAA